METKSNSFLMEEPVSRLMGKYAVPCIISLLVGALYNIVDQIFIANASYLGSYGNAANTVVFSLILCAVYLIFSSRIIAMFGGTENEETFRHSKEYFFWITLGIPFYMFGQAMNPVIRADGSPKYAMVSTLAGAAVLVVWYLAHLKTVKLAGGDFKLKRETIHRTLILGICSFLSQISLVAAMAAGCIPIVGYNMGAGEIVFGVGFALILPGFYGLDGILYSMPVSDILTFGISFIVIVRTYRQLNGIDEKRRGFAQYS